MNKTLQDRTVCLGNLDLDMLIFGIENNNQRGPYSTGDMGIISHYTRVKAGPLPEEEVEFAICRLNLIKRQKQSPS